jgi:hypothetical protein
LPLLVFPVQARLDVDRQRRLIVLDREDIVAAVVDDLLAQVTLAEEGIPGDDASADGQDAEQLQGRLVFVGLGIDPHLRQHRRGRAGVGSDEVLARHRTVAAAAQGLAVEGDDRRRFVRQAGGEPTRQGRLESDDIEPAEEDRVGGFGGRLAPAEAEQPGEREPFVAAELGNRLIGLATGEHRQNGQGQNGGEGVAEAAAVSGVGDVGEDVE